VTPPTASNFTDLPQVADVLPAYNTGGLPANVPEAPWSAALIAFGLVAIAFAGMRRRRTATG
jgi:hypothetical protein